MRQYQNRGPQPGRELADPHPGSELNKGKGINRSNRPESGDVAEHLRYTMTISWQRWLALALGWEIDSELTLLASKELMIARNEMIPYAQQHQFAPSRLVM
jgi:hypothetical protein